MKKAIVILGILFAVCVITAVISLLICGGELIGQAIALLK